MENKSNIITMNPADNKLKLTETENNNKYNIDKNDTE